MKKYFLIALLLGSGFFLLKDRSQSKREKPLRAEAAAPQRLAPSPSLPAPRSPAPTTIPAETEEDPEQEMQTLEKDLSENAEHGEELYQLVGKYLETKSLPRGETYLKQLLREHPENAGAIHTALADLYAAVGKTKKALPHAERGFQAEPLSPAALTVLADVYAQLGDSRAKEMRELSVEAHRDVTDGKMDTPAAKEALRARQVEWKSAE